MKYEMRELRGDDLFSLLSIVSKIGIQDEITKAFTANDSILSQDQIKALNKKHGANKEALQKELRELTEEAIERRGSQIVGQLVAKIITNLGSARNEINTLLADLCGVDIDEIRNTRLDEYAEQVVAIFRAPEIKSFFTSLARSMR